MAAVAPEELLHQFGPYLPTDRFRALLRGADLPSVAHGAALMIDISGFTPLSTQLVQKYGARRASEELRRRLNPMFEATTGQVFQQGGSVIRLVGDGFMAWFDDDQPNLQGETLPGLIRAAAAAVNMQELMSLFAGLTVRIGIGAGTAYRSVVGQERYGLSDILSGPAVDAMIDMTDQAEPGQIYISAPDISPLSGSSRLTYYVDRQIWQLNTLDAGLMQSARRHRWPAWQSEINIYDALNAIRPFIDVTLRNPIESGLGNFTSELRSACPMFIRITGINASPADVPVQLNHCVKHIQDVLADTGGRLVSVEISDKGNVVFAVFGAPVSYGDDAQRALSAAFTLRKMTADDPAAPCLLQFGISQGLLYAGIVGGEARHEYSTIGADTNIAARLMSAARPNQILITSHVRESLKRRITYKDLPPLMVKGRENPVAVSEALSSEEETILPTHSEFFVGRETELTQFDKALTAIQHGMTRLISIEGDSGVGKSRLLNEMTSHAYQQNCRVLRGSCLSTARNTPYVPWREVLIGLFGLAADLPEAINAERLTLLFKQFDPDWAWRLPLLTDLLQLPLLSNPTVATLSGRSRQQALSTLIIDLLRYFVAQKPLVLIFDDIHWIDEVSETLLLDLLRNVNTVPMSLCLIMSYRPLAGERSGLQLAEALREHRNHVAIKLNELALNEVEQLIAGRFKGFPPASLTRFLYEQTRGNPFLIHEVLDVLEETGAIRVRSSQITLTKALEDLKLPSSAQELVQARIDRLDETDKLVLKVAAVIGRQFSIALLEKSIPFRIEHSELVKRLASLETHNFSRRETDDSDTVYQFDHAITQDVAYQSLTFEQREQIHQSVGTALKALVPDEVEQLAHHFVRSGKTNRDNARYARQYLAAAAYKAIREYANQSALTYLQEAIALSDNPIDEFDLLSARLDVLLRIGQLEGIEGELGHAEQLLIEQKREDWRSQIGLRRAQHLYQLGKWSSAIIEAERAWESATAFQQDAIAWEIGLLLLDLYRTANRASDLDRVLAAMTQIVARLNDPYKDIQLTLQQLSDLYPERPVEALKGAKAVLMDAESLGDVALQAVCWGLIARIHQFEIRYPAALSATDNQLALLKRIGNRHEEGGALLRSGGTLILIGQFSEASQLLTQSYTIMHQLGERYGEAVSLNTLGIIAWLRYAYDEALAYLRRGLATLRELNAGLEIGFAAFHLGNVLLSKGEVDGAKVVFQESAVILKEKGHLLEAAEVDAGLAELHLYLGDSSSADLAIQPLSDILLSDQINRLQQPGLAYWRAIYINQTLGKTDMAQRLQEKAIGYQGRVLATLNSPIEQAAFADHLWYHKAIREWLKTSS